MGEYNSKYEALKAADISGRGHETTNVYKCEDGKWDYDFCDRIGQNVETFTPEQRRVELERVRTHNGRSSFTDDDDDDDCVRGVGGSSGQVSGSFESTSRGSRYDENAAYRNYVRSGQKR